jgi:epsin
MTCVLNHCLDYGSYGGGGGGGSSSGGFRDSAAKTSFEEYDAGDDETVARPSAPSTSTSRRTTTNTTSTSSRTAPSAPAPKQKEPEKVVDLLGFGDDDAFGSTSTSTGVNKALPAVGAQAAPVSLDGMALHSRSQDHVSQY